MTRSVAADSVPKPVIELCGQLTKAGYGAWVVGGSLRDVLLGRPASDWDIATSATPEEVSRVFRRTIPTGVAHGTVTVLFQGGSYEVTTLRGEGAYSDSRRPDSVFFVKNIEDDLARRDFTVNAIAWDPITGRLIDPWSGLPDLDARVIRTVGAAHERFTEDGLRVLRAARFAATLEFDLDPQTRAGITPALPSFQKVSRERVREEWIKTMKARTPSRAFDVMRETGILSITCPELVEQFGCAQNHYHAYDVWRHSMECMDNLHGDAIHRLAGLLHDLGKPATRALSDKTNDWTFYNHETVGAKLADAWLREYRFANDERERIVHLVRHHLVCYSSEWTDAAVRRFVKRVGADRVADLLALAKADALGKGRPVDAELSALDELIGRIDSAVSQGAAFGVKQLVVDGRDVMTRLQMAPSRKVGEILERLLDAVLDQPELNEREALLTLVDRIGAERGNQNAAS